MKIVATLLLLLLLPAVGLSAEPALPAGPHQMHSAPDTVREIRKYVDDEQPGVRPKFSVQPVHDNEIFAVFRADRLEYRLKEGEDTGRSGLDRRRLQ